MVDIENELRRDVLIATRSKTLAEIAPQLLAEDAGAALIRAAITCWEQEYGKTAAIELATTAIAAMMLDLNRPDAKREN